MKLYQTKIVLVNPAGKEQVGSAKTLWFTDRAKAIKHIVAHKKAQPNADGFYYDGSTFREYELKLTKTSILNFLNSLTT